MLKLSQLYLRAGRRIEDKATLTKRAFSIFGRADKGSRDFFSPLETGVVVQVRRGKLDIIVYFTTDEPFISDYRNIGGSLEALVDSACRAGEWVQSEIVKQLGLQDKNIEESRVTKGDLGQLLTIGRLVAEQEMSARDAHQKAVHLFDRAGEGASKELSQGLLAFFTEVAKSPEKWPFGPRKMRRVPQGRHREARVRRRGVQIERKPGEKNSSLSNL